MINALVIGAGLVLLLILMLSKVTPLIFYTCNVVVKCQPGQQKSQNGTCELCPFNFFKTETELSCVSCGSNANTKRGATSRLECTGIHHAINTKYFLKVITF